MSKILTGLVVIISLSTAASALYADGPAYPSNWNGGAPLPALNTGESQNVGSARPYYQPRVVYSGTTAHPMVGHNTQTTSQTRAVYQPRVQIHEKIVPRSDFFWMPEFHPFGPYNDYINQGYVVIQPQRPSNVHEDVLYAGPKGTTPQQGYVLRSYTYKVLVPTGN